MKMSFAKIQLVALVHPAGQGLRGPTHLADREICRMSSRNFAKRPVRQKLPSLPKRPVPKSLNWLKRLKPRSLNRRKSPRPLSLNRLKSLRPLSPNRQLPLLRRLNLWRRGKWIADIPLITQFQSHIHKCIVPNWSVDISAKIIGSDGFLWHWIKYIGNF
jgi:hypothetical protein